MTSSVKVTVTSTLEDPRRDDATLARSPFFSVARLRRGVVDELSGSGEGVTQHRGRHVVVRGSGYCVTAFGSRRSERIVTQDRRVLRQSGG
jgi:hypothetical protein